jgi:hypothetical protein
MPQLLAIIPFIVAGANLAQTGFGLANSIGGGGGPQTPATPKPTPPDANALAKLRQRIGSADANTQAQTSGTAGDDFRRFIDQWLAGTTGQPGSAGAAQSTVMESQFAPANSQPTNAVVGNQVPNLSEFLNSFSA